MIRDRVAQFGRAVRLYVDELLSEQAGQVAAGRRVPGRRDVEQLFEPQRVDTAFRQVELDPVLPRRLQPLHRERFDAHGGSLRYLLGAGQPTLSQETVPEMVAIPAGEFIMGSDDGDEDERPAHPVHLDELLDRHRTRSPIGSTPASSRRRTTARPRSTSCRSLSPTAAAIASGSSGVSALSTSGTTASRRTGGSTIP